MFLGRVEEEIRDVFQREGTINISDCINTYLGL